MAVVGATALAFVAPSSAAVHHTAARNAGVHHGISAHSSGAQPHTVANSTYLAGHSVTPADGLASVSATFRMPTIDCSHDTDLRGQIFGIVDEPTVGAPVAFASVWGYCQDGVAGTLMETMAGSDIDDGGAVAPNDLMVATFSQTASTVRTTIRDITQNTVVTSSDVPSGETNVVIGDGPLFAGSQLQPAPFGHVNFTQVQVNGEYLGFAGSNQLNLRHLGHLLVQTLGVLANHNAYNLIFKAVA
jgi:hypothetical protein